ncbi:MAG: dihydropteroate synthase [bacterium]
MNVEKFEQLLASNKTLISGVLNVTPDSFSDGGLFLDPNEAVARALQMLDEGADIIDIGGQSTRPPGSAYGGGAEEVSLDEEISRVLPVIQLISAARPEVLISIDTTKSRVAQIALENGATIINDVSGGTGDDQMFEVVRKFEAPIVLMHGYGTEFTKSKIEEYEYIDVVGEVLSWLHYRIGIAQEMGIKHVLADVGFGFAKGAEDNLKLLGKHDLFGALGVPLMLGVSRKSTIGKILGGAVPSERVSGSIGAAIFGALHDAKIIRTHDVKATADALKVVDRLRDAL